MSALHIKVAIFVLIIIFVSVYRFTKHGIKGLDWAFYVLSISIIFAVIEAVMEGITFKPVWIVFIVTFIFSTSMLVFIKIKFRNENRERSDNKKRRP
jgi:uncharacterized membrane protein